MQSGGSLRRPVNVHFEVFSDELMFYQLGADVLERYRADEGMTTTGASEPMPTNAVQRAVWTLLENPESSLAARIVAILSVSVIVLSIATFCLETLPELKRYHRPISVQSGSVNDSSLSSDITGNQRLHFVMCLKIYSCCCYYCGRVGSCVHHWMNKLN